MKRRYQTIKGYSGIFKVEIFDPLSSQWRKPIRGGSFAEAKAFRYSHRTTKKSGNKTQPTVTPTPNTVLLFKDLIEVWVRDWLPNKDLSTQIRYRSYLKHFAFFSDIPVESIEPSTIDSCITHIKNPEYLATRHNTRCSYRHEFSVLRGILNFYSSRFNRNYRLPFIKDHRSMLKVREKMKVVKDLTVEEFKSFLGSLREVCNEFNCEVIFYLAMMQYALYCRVQEAAALHCEDFDSERNRVTIKRKVQWLRAKGYENRIVDGSKVNGGKILPAIPELASKVLKEWLLKSGTREGLLFHQNGKLLSYRQIEYRYSQALKRSGLPFTATHILRHAALSEHYGSCKDVYATKAVAGHSDLRSTMKYVKVRSETVAEAQQLMDKRISSIL